MVRKKPVKRASKAKFKKCIIAKIRGTKISTPKSAQRAFRIAAKKCKHLLAGIPVHHKKSRRRKRKYTPGIGTFKRRYRYTPPFEAGGLSRYALPPGF
jgi:hypothetical protein